MAEVQVSTWNDYPTPSQLSDLRRAWMILNYDYTEADIPETRREARNLQYELWGKVRRLHSTGRGLIEVYEIGR